MQLQKQIFGVKGFSTDLQLTADELTIFRHEIQKQWLDVIKQSYPHLYEEASRIGIENYHLIADRMDHKKTWAKSNRFLPRHSVEVLQKLTFFSILKEEFGDFKISDVYDTYQHHDEPEIYWRLVRPNEESDVGPLHKDKWFHGAMNSGYGMFAEDEVTVKIWIPIFCEPGKNGLMIASGSHLKEWRYHIVHTDGVGRPVPDDDLSNVGAQLIPTAPGNALIFNEGILHAGAVNRGNKTRVSTEITLVLKKEQVSISETI